MVIVVIAHLFILGPMLAGLAGDSRIGQAVALLLVSVPLYFACGWAWKHRHFPIGNRILRGDAARRAALVLVALDLLWIAWMVLA